MFVRRSAPKTTDSPLPEVTHHSPASADSVADSTALPIWAQASTPTMLQRQDDGGGDSLLGIPPLTLSPEIEAQIRAIEMMHRLLTPSFLTSAATGTPSFSLGTAGLTLSPPGQSGSMFGIPPLSFGPTPTLPPLSPSFLPPPTPPWLLPTPRLTPPPLVPAGPGPSTPRPGEVGDIFRAILRIPAVDGMLTTLRDDAASRARSEWASLSTGERVLVISHGVIVGGSALAGVLSSPEGRSLTLDLIQDRDLPVPGVPGMSFRFNATGPNPQVFFNLDLAQLIPVLR